MLPPRPTPSCTSTAGPPPEDRLTSPEDLAACVTLDGPQPHDPRHRYVIGLDLGLKKDRTVLAVCHAERMSGPPLVVLDRPHVLAGTRERPVSLADIEMVAHKAATIFGAPIRLDPWQAVGLAQRAPGSRGKRHRVDVLAPSRWGGWR